MENNCPLCEAVNDAANLGYSKEYNTVLYETDNFYVLPCIGPLVEGHILIVSKGHTESLASSSKGHVAEVSSILSLVATNDTYLNSLVTEHGSLADQAGGACIVHCHLHVIPGMGKYVSALEALLPVRVLESLNDILRVTYPYILSMRINEQIKVYEAYNAHSQMMRKAICAELKRNDGDWKKYHDINVSKRTLELWKNRII